MYRRAAKTELPHKLEAVRCNLCGADDTGLFFRGRNLWDNTPERIYYNVVRCKRCGLRYLNPRLSASAIGTLYQEDYISYGIPTYTPEPLSARGEIAARWRREIFDGWQGKQAPSMVRQLLLSFAWHLRRIRYDALRFRGEGRRLLEIGCGLGDYLAHKKSLGWDVCGVELTSHAVKICRDRGLSVMQEAFDGVGWAADSFDAIVLRNVLEHVLDPLDVLRQSWRILKPGGIVDIVVPNAHSIPAWLFGSFWSGLHVPYHNFFYTPKTLAAFLQRAGLRMLSWYTLSSTTGYTLSLEWVLRDRLRLSIRRECIRHHKLLCKIAVPFVRLGDWVKLGDNLHIIARKPDS